MPNALTFLRRLAAGSLPRSVAAGPDFESMLACKAAGWIDAAIPPKSKGKDTYGQQPDALVTAITSAGKRALE